MLGCFQETVFYIIFIESLEESLFNEWLYREIHKIKIRGRMSNKYIGMKMKKAQNLKKLYFST